MMVMALLSLAVALAASVWTTAYAWTDILPSLLWLDRARRHDAWLDSIEALHGTLAMLRALDAQERLDVLALTT